MSHAAVLFVCSTMLTGCIIARDLDYEDPPNLPPSVHGTPTSPMNQVIEVDSDPIAADAGTSANLDFVAIVRDPNVDDELLGLVFVDYDPTGTNQPVLPEIRIPPSSGADPLTREVRFSIPRGLFPSQSCWIVELHVSRSFVGFNDPQPADPDDLGVGVWWVVRDDEGNQVRVSECGAGESGS